MSGLKRCSRCGESKPADPDHFARHKRSADGLYSWCKVCKHAYHKERKVYAPVPPPKTERTCNKCKRVFPITAEFFHKYKKGLYGLRETCKECCCAYANSHRGGRLKPVMPVQPGMRYCHTCKEYKPEDAAHFKANQRYRKGLETTCRVCAGNRTKRWGQRNPLKVRAICARRRARLKAAPGDFTQEDMEHQHQAQAGKCFWCGIEIALKRRTTHVDHLIPISKGGSNFPSNLVIACQPCNSRKSDKMPWEFMPERFSPPNADAAD